MFSFRCYTCSLTMKDGIPPLEALSEQQIGEVGAEVPEGMRRFSVLEGTPYEGMSVYSFCAFCFTVIQDYPSGRSVKCTIKWTQEHDWEAPIQWHAIECTVHGELYRCSIDTEKGEYFSRFDKRNRMAIFHRVQLAYPNADLSQLIELRDMEI